MFRWYRALKARWDAFQETPRYALIMVWISIAMLFPATIRLIRAAKAFYRVLHATPK